MDSMTTIPHLESNLKWWLKRYDMALHVVNKTMRRETGFLSPLDLCPPSFNYKYVIADYIDKTPTKI